jgi:SAM-dependent methyltransferase
MMDEDLRLLIDLHTHQKRQGPGGDHETKKAIELAGLNSSTPLRIADIGCGTGASTLILERLSHYGVKMSELPEKEISTDASRS